MIDAEPVLRHVHELLAAGMDPGRIAGLGGISALHLERLLQGVIKRVMVRDARSLLSIPIPEP